MSKIKAAHTPEARAKAAETRKRTMAAKKQAAEALGSIPLDAIPDRAPKRKSSYKSKKAHAVTRQEVVLAILQYLNGE
jgi:hypothetical protein